MALGPVDPALRPSTRDNLPQDTAIYAVPGPSEFKDVGLKRAYDFDDGDSDLDLGRYEKRTRLSPCVADGGSNSVYATDVEEELSQDEAADQEPDLEEEQANENILDGTESLDMGWTEGEWMAFMAELVDFDAAGAPEEEALEKEAEEEESEEEESSEEEASEEESEEEEASGEESEEEDASIEESEGQMVHNGSTTTFTDDANQSAKHDVIITPEEFNTLINCRVVEWTESVLDTLHSKITSAVYQRSWDQKRSICLSEYVLAEKHLGGYMDVHLGCSHLFPLESRSFLSPSPTPIPRPKAHGDGWLPFSDRAKRGPSRLCQEITDDIPSEGIAKSDGKARILAKEKDADADKGLMVHANGDASSSEEDDTIPVGASSPEALSTVHDPKPRRKRSSSTKT